MEQEDAVSVGSWSPSPEHRYQSPSPKRQRGRRGRSPAPQTVYCDSGAGTSWPMLTKSNYHEWSLLMKVKLQARHLWDAVHLGGVTYEEDRRALEALCAAVPLDIAASIANKRTAKLAWDAIALRRVGGDRVRRATLQRLRGEWEGLAFQPGEHVEDFAVRLSSLMEQMKLNGDTDLTEERAVEKLLRCMPKRYRQIVNSIETLLDFDALTIEDVTGRLKSVQDRELADDLESANAGGKLLYTAEQWRAFDKKKKEEAAGPSKDKRRRPRGGKKNKPRGDRDGGGAGGGGAQADKAGGADGERKANRDDLCLNCHQAGHWARDCPHPRRNRERGGAANVAQVDEDAAAFLAHGFLELDAQGSCSKAQASIFCAKNGCLELEEPRARAYLDTGNGEKMDGWYLDSGATHHMTGRRELFTDLDTSARGSVRFGDESKVEIHGVGSIIFEAKNGEHRVLHGVYFIPALRNSIMSLGQLNEGGSKVEIEHGVLTIWDRHRRLLVKVRCGANRLYVLHLNQAKPLCLAARKDDEAWR